MVFHEIFWNVRSKIKIFFLLMHLSCLSLDFPQVLKIFRDFCILGVEEKNVDVACNRYRADLIGRNIGRFFA